MGAGAAVGLSPRVVVADVPDGQPLPFPKHGVRLSYYAQFVEECGGRDALQGLTTTEVCDTFVKPATARLQASYCDLLAWQDHGAVGMASVFISHAWKYVFLDVVDALLYHFRDEPGIVVWFDLFSNNQHKAVDLDFFWWSNTFKSAIEQFGRTVMVLAPWHDPIPLTRGWCLFELYCTADTGSVFEVAMSRENQRQFFEDMTREGLDAVNKMLATINAERSECWKAEDRDHIFDAVRRTVGFAGINAMVFEQLRDWVVAVTTSALQEEADELAAAGLKDTLAKLYEGQGKYALAEPLYLEVLTTTKEELGDHHHNTLATLNNLAFLYESQGEYDRAEPLYVEVLVTRKHVLGDQHPHTLASLNNLAFLYERQGKHELAEPLYSECLAAKKEALGDRHPSTLATLNNLAGLYETQGKYDLAEPLYVECVASTKEVLGDRHPSTLATLNNSAALYKSAGKYDLAEPLYVECLVARKEVLGDRHPDTLSSLNNLAGIYYSQGKYDVAEPLYLECLATRKEVLGDDHPHTSASAHNLRIFYEEMALKQGGGDE